MKTYSQFAARHGGVSKGLPPRSALFNLAIVGDVVWGSVSLRMKKKMLSVVKTI